MIKAEDKTIECMSCGQMLVLSGYNNTVCPGCGITHHEIQSTLLAGEHVLKEWCDRLEAAGKKPKDCVDDLIRQIKISNLREQKIVSLGEWKKLTAVFRGAEAQVSPNKEETQ